MVTAVLAGKLGQWNLGKSLLNLLYPVDISGARVVLAAVMVALGLGAAKLGEDAIALNKAIEKHYERHGSVPASLDELATVEAATLTDPWGGAFRYEPHADGVSFSLRSDGPDRQTGTGDDVELWRRFGEDAEFDLRWGRGE